MPLILLIIQFTLPGATALGDRIFYGDAQSIGMGGISVVFLTGDNPAASGLTDRYYGSLTGCLVVDNERRGLRVYDSYGNNLGISTVYSHAPAMPAAGPVSLVMPLGMVRVGVRYTRNWDHEYHYHNEYRDDFYQVVRVVDEDYGGAVSGLSPQVAVTAYRVTVGMAQDFLSYRATWHYQALIPDGADTVRSSEASYHGGRIRVGILYAPTSHLRLGYRFAGETTLDADSVSATYPAAHAVGIWFRPAGRVPTAFAAEVIHEQWPEPVLVYKVGLEHLMLGRYALRYGFVLFPDYRETTIYTTGLTLGVGWQRENYHLDIGYAYAKRDYRSLDFGGLGTSTDYYFDEAVSHFLLTLGVSF